MAKVPVRKKPAPAPESTYMGSHTVGKVAGGRLSQPGAKTSSSHSVASGMAKVGSPPTKKKPAAAKPQATTHSVSSQMAKTPKHNEVVAKRGSYQGPVPKARLATKEEASKSPLSDETSRRAAAVAAKRSAAGAKIAGAKITREGSYKLNQSATANHRRTSATAGLGERGARAIYSAGKQVAHNVAQNSMAANRAVENVGRKVGGAAAKVGKKVSDTARSAERGGVRGALGKVGSALGGHAQRAINAGVGTARKVAGAVGNAAKKVAGGIPGAARKVGQAVMGQGAAMTKDRFKQAVSRRKSLGDAQDRAESFIKRLAGVTEEED